MKRPLLLVLAGLFVCAACSAPPAPGTPPPAPGAPASPAANAAPPAQAVVPAAAVTESVAELPDYPGAIRVGLTQGAAEHGYARKLQANWTSADPFATVVAFYQKEIAGRGWTVTGTESKATEIEWKLAKGTSVAKVEVKQGVPVTIKIERSDR